MTTERLSDAVTVSRLLEDLDEHGAQIVGVATLLAPAIDVEPVAPRPGEPPLGVGESSSVPGTAAIACSSYESPMRASWPPPVPAAGATR